MGISTNFYTIYGIKIDWDEDFYNAYDEVYDDQDTPWILMDEMSGEYMVFGGILFDSGDARFGFEDSDLDRQYDGVDLYDIETKYVARFKAKFPDHYERLLKGKHFKLIGLAHYS